MATVNHSALNVLTRKQADEACRLIDAIGYVSNDLTDSNAAIELDKARTELKRLFCEINDDRYPVIG